MKQQKEPDDEWNGVGDEDCDGAALHESSGDESLGAWVKQWKEPDDEWNGVSDESLGLETKQEKEQNAVS